RTTRRPPRCSPGACSSSLTAFDPEKTLAPTRRSRPTMTSVRPVRLRFRVPVRVAGHAGVELMRINETQLDVLSERLRMTAWAVRARAVQRSGRVVIVSGERAPRLALVLIDVLAAAGHFPG